VPPEPDRDEHKSAAPRFSPGVVRSDEIVLRTVLDPDHLEPNGKLALAAIALEDIRFRGWSVDRKCFTSFRRVQSEHFAWKRRKPHLQKIHVLPIAVSDIRSVGNTTGQQHFVVTDTSVWRNPAHADVLLSSRQGEGAARGFRTQLFQKLPPYTDLATTFDTTENLGYLRGMFWQLIAILRSAFRRAPKSISRS
jgi:hypothetical protein